MYFTNFIIGIYHRDIHRDIHRDTVKELYCRGSTLPGKEWKVKGKKMESKRKVNRKVKNRNTHRQMCISNQSQG